MVTIELADDEALVLFDLLTREIDRHQQARLAGIIEHPAEFWALNSVHTTLETNLEQPFSANFSALLDQARSKVVDRYDPERSFGPIGGGN
jgi:hypothetical protein